MSAVHHEAYRQHGGGIKIHLYQDVDSPNTNVPLVFEAPDPVNTRKYKAEDLCQDAARALKIGSRAFHCFALCSMDGSQWFAPNQDIECSPAGERKEYRFRMRFIPTDDRLYDPQFDTAAYDYFFLQVRHDFVEDNVEYKLVEGKKISQGRLLGLAVVDVLRWGKERSLDVKQLQKNGSKTKKFIPKSQWPTFRMPWDMHRLNFNFNKNLENVYNDCLDQTDKVIKRRYLRGFFSYVLQYGMETFEPSDNGLGKGGKRRITVDPYHAKYSGIYYTAEEGVPPQHVCTIEELVDVQLSAGPGDAETSMVHINRKSGSPVMLHFGCRASALGFVSLLDGYYRLAVDHMYHLCPAVTSPTVRALRAIGAHGPVSSAWAIDRLQKRNAADSNYNFLLRQHKDSLHSFLLAVVRPDGTLHQIPMNRLGSTGQFQLAVPGEPVFDSFQKLVEHYKTAGRADVQLRQCVRPSNPVDPILYLCRMTQSTNQSAVNHDDDLIVQDANGQQQATARLISAVNISNTCLGRGRLTEVFRGSWDRELHGQQQAAVKQLSVAGGDGDGGLLQGLMEGVQRAAFWHNPAIIAVYAVCLAPRFRAVLELADQGPLHEYLRRFHTALRTQHLVAVAEQVAHALVYLCELPATHCGVRARNVLVCHHSEHSIAVKLADPGLAHHANRLPLAHPLNAERLPWIAPECYTDLRTAAPAADVYSYGVFLWEVFSAGARPYRDMAPAEIQRLARSGAVLEQPDKCPAEMYRVLRECCLPEPDRRKPPKEILRDARNCPVGGDSKYSIPTWDSETDLAGNPGDDATAAAAMMAENEINGHLDAAGGGDTEPGVVASLGDVTVATETGGGGDSVLMYGSTDPLLLHSSGSSADTLLSHDGGGKNNGGVVSAATSAASQRTDITVVTTDDASSPMNPPARSVGVATAMANRPLPPPPAADSQAAPGVPCLANSFEIADSTLSIDFRTPLGAGHYGEVYRGRYKPMFRGKKVADHVEVACKALKATQVSQFYLEFEEEIRTMGRLDHPNIVKLIGQCHRGGRHSHLIVMEFVERGCLRDYLHKCLDEKNAGEAVFVELPYMLEYCRQICQGMLYLSGERIVHRDLAARNVLVTRDRVMKIADFGLAHMLDGKRDYYKGNPGKPIPALWCSPEALTERKFTVKSDVWSFGVTCWEIFSHGSSPKFAAANNDGDMLDRLHQGERLKRPQHCPREVYRKFIYPCWHYRPEERADFSLVRDIVEELTIRHPLPSPGGAGTSGGAAGRN